MSNYVPSKFKPVKIGIYKVVDVAYHRNGISGEGFMTGLFHVTSGDKSERGKFVFTLFTSWSGKDKEETFDNCTGDYRCAVLRLEDLNKGTSENAWRGDYFYHNVVQDAVREYNRQYDAYYKTGVENE